MNPGVTAVRPRWAIEGGRISIEGSGFVVDDSHRVETAMRERGVIASARGPVIRLAPHFYSTIEDVDISLDVLAEVVRRS